MGNETAVVCFCPVVNMVQDCVHTRFLEELGETQFGRSHNDPDERKSIIYAICHFADLSSFLRQGIPGSYSFLLGHERGQIEATILCCFKCPEKQYKGARDRDPFRG